MYPSVYSRDVKVTEYASEARGGGGGGCAVAVEGGKNLYVVCFWSVLIAAGPWPTSQAIVVLSLHALSRSGESTIQYCVKRYSL